MHPALVCVQGFRLRLVGHSLGGATASLLAMMLRKKSEEEIGIKYEKKLKALSIDEVVKEEENMEEEGVPIDIQPMPEENSGDNDDEEKIKRRTVFIHNLPLSAKKKDISKVFASYGPLEAINLQANSASSDVSSKIPYKERLYEIWYQVSYHSFKHMCLYY